MQTIQTVCLMALGLLLLAGPALADDWTAVRLRGSVFANDIHGTGEWAKLSRGAVVSDDRVIRTLASAAVDFVRGNETVSMGPNTQAQIVDRTGKLYTTVVQQSGAVTIAAEARNVQHFAVQTPYLVAVVKGTQFTVTTGTSGSGVAVDRGMVAVTDLLSRRTVLVAAGQRAAADTAGHLVVTGTANQSLAHPVVNGVVEDAGLDGTAGAGELPFGVALRQTLGGVGGTVEGVTDLAGGLVAGTGDLVGTTLDTAGGLVGNTLGQTGGLVGGVLGSAGGLGQALGPTLGGTTSGLGATVGGTTSGLGQTVSGVTSTVGATVGGLGATVHGLLSGL